MKPLSFWIRALALVLIAVVITLATGELHIPGWGYGLPLPWKRDLSMDCGTRVCPLVHIGFFVYNWFFFLLDVLFYTGIGYGLFLAVGERNALKRARVLRLGILAYVAFMVYLLEANILHQVGVANLPLSLGTSDAFQQYGIQMTLLVLTFLGVLAMGVVKKRRRIARQVP
jgi:hypothetical protein